MLHPRRSPVGLVMLSAHRVVYHAPDLFPSDKPMISSDVVPISSSDSQSFTQDSLTELKQSPNNVSPTISDQSKEQSHDCKNASNSSSEKLSPVPTRPHIGSPSAASAQCLSSQPAPSVTVATGFNYHVGQECVTLQTPKPRAIWEFLVHLVIVNHPNKIRRQYESVIHVENVRQTARILHISDAVYASSSAGAIKTATRQEGITSSSTVCRARAQSSDLQPPTPHATQQQSMLAVSTPANEFSRISLAKQRSRSELQSCGDEDQVEGIELGNGDRAVCRFRFLFRPEFVHIGSPLMLRDGRIRAVGNIIDIID